MEPEEQKCASSPTSAVRQQELKDLLLEGGLNEASAVEILDVLLANNISSVNELAAFPLDKLPTLKLKPKGRSVLKTIIPKLNESFRLKELFSMLWYNINRDYEKTAKILQEQLEIDSWPSFLELEEADLEGVAEIEPLVRQELLELIEFANSFDKAKLARDIEALKSRRAHDPEDLSDILALYDLYNTTINKAVIMIDQRVPLKVNEQELIKQKEILKLAKANFEEQFSQEQSLVDDTDNELVSFNESFGELYLNDCLLTRLRNKFSSEVPTPSHICTFVGATHVGKSTMIRQLTAPGEKVPAVAARNNYYPTTGNVHIYHSDMQMLHPQYEPSPVCLVDIEGSNSPSIPKYVLNTFTSQLKKLMTEGGQSIVDKRRKAVNLHLPRFAYVISDVIVYIGEGSWANTEYRDNVVSFANAAVENVASAIRPCIIIVHNKCNLYEPMDVEIMTKKFLQLHENNDENQVLTKLYDQVKCISIPDWYHDHVLFDQQIVKLKRIMGEMLDSQMRKRQRLGCLLSQTQWLDLLQYVVANFTSKSLRIGTFVGELVSPEHSLAKNAFQFFNTIYDAKTRQVKPNDPDLEWRDYFLKCRRLATFKLAMLLLADLRQENHTSTFPVLGESDSLQQSALSAQFTNEVMESKLMKWNLILEVFSQFMQNRLPCCSIYKGVKDENGNSVICTQEYGQHDAHRSAVMVYAPPADDGFFERVMAQARIVFNIKIPSVWDGEYDFGAPFPDLQADKDLLKERIEALHRLSSRDFFIDMVELVRESTSTIEPTLPEDICFICQANNCTRRLVPCGHAFCEFCAVKLILIQSRCPVCRHPKGIIERVIEYVEITTKPGKVVTADGIKAVQDQIVKLVPHPFKIVSVIGKIPPDFKKEFQNLEDVVSISGERINPLRNFAFCSRFTGSKSCLYVEGEDQKSVIIHYAVDKYFDKPCVLPYLTSDVIVLLDTNFMFRLPEKFVPPFIIEPVTKQSRVRMPYRVTSKIMMNYLSPPAIPKEQRSEQSSPSFDAEKRQERRLGDSSIELTSSQGVSSNKRITLSDSEQNVETLPAALARPKSRYSMLEWCLYSQEILQVHPDYSQIFVYGGDLFLKKKQEYFLYCTPLKKLTKFFQMVEKKYFAFPDFIGQLLFINLIASCNKYYIDIYDVEDFVLELLTMCKAYFIDIYAGAKDYHSSSIINVPFGKLKQDEEDNEKLFDFLDAQSLSEEIELIEAIKTRLQTTETKRIVTLRRLMCFKNLLLKKIQPGPKEKELFEIYELFSRNQHFCLLCMDEFKGREDELKCTTCNHLICDACWADIQWLDDRQHQFYDLLDPAIYTYRNGFSIPYNNPAPIPETAQPTNTNEASSTNATASNANVTAPEYLSPVKPGQASPHRDDSKPSLLRPAHAKGRYSHLCTLPPVTKVHRDESTESHVSGNFAQSAVTPKYNFRRILLLFRCPVCDEFLLSRLHQYINADTSLVKVVERSAHLQCVLDETNSGDIILHNHISPKEITNLEPIADSVYKARYQNNVVAIKYFRPYFIGFEWSRLRTEVAILRICSHANIISFLGANVPDQAEIDCHNWKDSDQTLLKPFIVFEYIPETLSEIVRASNKVLPLSRTLSYAFQISKAIQFLHSLGIVHRDLKPGNVVIAKNVAKVIDFGESRVLRHSNEALTRVGTPFYEAPEVLTRNYSEKVDSYSFGKMLFEMVTKSINPSALAARQFYEPKGPGQSDDYSVILDCDDEILINLVKLCCQQAPNQRPDFEVIVKLLNETQQRHAVSVKNI